MSTRISDDTLRYAVGCAVTTASTAHPDAMVPWPEWHAAYDVIHDTPMDPAARIVINAVASGLPKGGFRDTFVVTLAAELKARRYDHWGERYDDSADLD